jgi:aryl-alcohol dehydrogenase-like predicted oxidoreductase
VHLKYPEARENGLGTNLAFTIARGIMDRITREWTIQALREQMELSRLQAASLDNDADRRKDATTAQLSLAWLLAKKPFIVPIPGTGKVKHLEENIEAANLVLTAEDLKEIDRALSEFKVHGGRMNEQQMQVVES